MEYMIFSGENGPSVRQFVDSRGCAARIVNGDLYVGSESPDTFVPIGYAIMIDGDKVGIHPATPEQLGTRRGALRCPDERDVLLEKAMGLIANAGWNATTGATDGEKAPGWHAAALEFRDRYHRLLHNG